MFFNEIIISNFRNIKYAQLYLHPKKNLFYGQNGLGKTNCLEAISMLSSLRPLQTLSLFDLILHNEDHAKILALANNAKIEVNLYHKKKSASLNDKPILRAKKLAEHFLQVSFIPEELNMITQSPKLRRSALDQAAINLFVEHYSYLRDYEKILHHRNKLLKNSFFNKDELSVFTNMLIEKAANIIFTRINTINILQDFFQKEIKNILGAHFDARIKYELYGQKLDLNKYALSDIKQMLFNANLMLEKEEFLRKQTLFGPHLDNLAFYLNGKTANKYSSRGETRSLVLAFKIAHMKAIKDHKNISPIIILDDIFSELDEEKKYNMLTVIDDINGQCFFSSTNSDILSYFGSQIKAFKLTSPGIIHHQNQ